MIKCEMSAPFVGGQDNVTSAMLRKLPHGLLLELTANIIAYSKNSFESTYIDALKAAAAEEEVAAESDDNDMDEAHDEDVEEKKKKKSRGSRSSAAHHTTTGPGDDNAVSVT